MSGFNAKRISPQEIVKIGQNAVFNPKWSKTQFTRKSCISWLDLMQTHFSARIGENLAKHCFQLTIAQNTVFRKSFIAWVDLMQNTFSHQKW